MPRRNDECWGRGRVRTTHHTPDRVRPNPRFAVRLPAPRSDANQGFAPEALRRLPNESVERTAALAARTAGDDGDTNTIMRPGPSCSNRNEYPGATSHELPRSANRAQPSTTRRAPVGKASRTSSTTVGAPSSSDTSVAAGLSSTMIAAPARSAVLKIHAGTGGRRELVEVRSTDRVDLPLRLEMECGAGLSTERCAGRRAVGRAERPHRLRDPAAPTEGRGAPQPRRSRQRSSPPPPGKGLRPPVPRALSTNRR